MVSFIWDINNLQHFFHNLWRYVTFSESQNNNINTVMKVIFLCEFTRFNLLDDKNSNFSHVNIHHHFNYSLEMKKKDCK